MGPSVPGLPCPSGLPTRGSANQCPKQAKVCPLEVQGNSSAEPLLQKSKVVAFHAQYGLQTPQLPPALFCWQTAGPAGALPRWFLITCVSQLSSTCSRNILDSFLPATLYFQQTSGKLKSCLKTRPRGSGCLQKISSSPLSCLGGLYETPTMTLALLGLPDRYPHGLNPIATINKLSMLHH